MDIDRTDAKVHQVKVTEVRIKRAFLKIFIQNIKGQNYQSLQCMEHVYRALENARNVGLGDLCMVKTEGEFHRCRVVNIEENQAVLDFIDSGFTATLPLDRLRSIPETHLYYNIPPICKPVYIAGLSIDTNVPNYREKIKNKIDSLLRNKIVHLTIAGEISPITLVNIEIKGIPLVNEILLNDPLCAEVLKPITICEQLSQLSHRDEPILQREILPESPEEKEVTKVPYSRKQMYALGSQHEVNIIASEGPQKFYVKFTTTENIEKFKALNELLRTVNLNPLKIMPSIGMKCIALISKDDSKCLEVMRAVVKNVIDEKINVLLLDKGIEMSLKLANLYVTSDKIFDVPPFAVRFRLHHIEFVDHLNQDEINFYFKEVTQYKNLLLTVCELDKPECLLRDIEEDIDILESLKAYDPRSLAYAKQSILQPGTYKVKVTCADSPSSFYVKLLDSDFNYAYYEKMLQMLNACELKCPSPGNVCGVIIKEQYYRAKFIKRISSALSEIQLVDYGTVCRVRNEKVKALTEKFMRDPPAAFKFCLSECRGSLHATFYRTKDFSNYAGQEIEVNVQSYEDGVYYVDIFDPSTAAEVKEQLSSEWSINSDKEQDECRISYVESATNFTIQSVERMKEMEKSVVEWQHILKNMEANLVAVQDVKYYELYVTIDPRKNLWVRVALHRIEKRGDLEVIILRNIDDGSLVEIDKENLKTTMIYEMPLDLRITNAYGVPCTLPIAINKFYDQSAAEFLLNESDKNLTYKILASNPNFNTIELFDKDSSLVSKLMELNCVHRVPFLSYGNIYITNVTNLREFYVQQCDDNDLILALLKFTQIDYKPITVINPKINQIVMAKYCNLWYRAKVLSTNNINGKYRVKFIDYGNKEEVNLNEIGALREFWVEQIPPIAVKCALDLPVTLDPKTPAAVDQFTKLSKLLDKSNKSLKPNNKFKASAEQDYYYDIKRNDRNCTVVTIYKSNGDQREDILSELLPLCVNATFSCPESDEEDVDSQVEVLSEPICYCTGDGSCGWSDCGHKAN